MKKDAQELQKYDVVTISSHVVEVGLNKHGLKFKRKMVFVSVIGRAEWKKRIQKANPKILK